MGQPARTLGKPFGYFAFVDWSYLEFCLLDDSRPGVKGLALGQWVDNGSGLFIGGTEAGYTIANETINSLFVGTRDPGGRQVLVCWENGLLTLRSTLALASDRLWSITLML
jgi:hypothetical protein